MDNVKQEEEKAAVVQRKLRENIAKRYPDQIPDNDDWTELEDRYSDEIESEVGRYKEGEMTMQELVSVYPELGMILNDMVANKVPFRVAITKYLSQEDLIPMEGEEDYSAYQSAYEERKKGVEKKKSLESQIQQNEANTIAAIDKYCDGKGYSEEEKEALFDFMNDIFIKMLHKEINENIVQALDNARNYNKDVESAKQIGKIEGRNENIELVKAKKPQSDGIPSVGSSADIAPKKQNGFFDDVKDRTWKK